MAVGAAGNFIRETEAVVLAVVALHVGFDGHIGDLVPGHHLLVAVTLQADLGVELAPFVIICTGQLVDGVQVVAVMAGS